MISSYEWEQTANHRFQGELDVESIARGACIGPTWRF